MKHIIAISALVLPLAASAQPYIGGTIGHGSTIADGAPQYSRISVDRKQDSMAVGLFAGYRRGWFAVEGGFIVLPEYHATASTNDYPAYKGCTVGPNCPQTASVTQDIFSRALYLRGNAYLPRVFGMEPYAFAGIAKTFNYNHEYGEYDCGEKVDFKVNFQNTAGLYGVGIQSNINQKLSARLEYFEMPKHADEEHTLQRTARMVIASVGYSF